MFLKQFLIYSCYVLMQKQFYAILNFPFPLPLLAKNRKKNPKKQTTQQETKKLLNHYYD